LINVARTRLFSRMNWLKKIDPTWYG